MLKKLLNLLVGCHEKDAEANTDGYDQAHQITRLKTDGPFNPGKAWKGNERSKVAPVKRVASWDKHPLLTCFVTIGYTRTKQYSSRGECNVKPHFRDDWLLNIQVNFEGFRVDGRGE